MMMKDKMLKELVEVINDNFDRDEIRPYYNYSGRGMYGRTCIGFSGDNVLSSLVDAMDYVVKTLELDVGVRVASFFFEMLSNMKQDSLGRGQIIYFPGYNIEGAVDEEEEGEE